MKSSALERAQAALKGKGKVLQKKKTVFDSQSSDDAGDLNQYLSTLSQKTGSAPVVKPKRSQVIAGLSDISISSDEETKPKPVQQTSNVSKFLKKKTPAPTEPVKPAPVKSSYDGGLSRTQTLESPALLKLSQQTQRIINKQSGAPVPKLRKSIVSESETDQSSEFGGGLRFLKKKSESPEPTTPSKNKQRGKKSPDLRRSLTISETISEDDSENMAAYMRGLETESEISEQPSKKALPKKTKASESQPVKDDSSFATESIKSETELKSESVVSERSKSSSKRKHSGKHSSSKSDKSKSKSPSRSAASNILTSLGLKAIDDLEESQTVASTIHERSLMESSIRSEIIYSVDSDSIKTESMGDNSIKTESIPSIKTQSIASEVWEVKTESVPSESKSYSEDFSEDETLKDTESIKSERSSSPDTISGRRGRASRRSYSSRSRSSSYSRSRSSSERSRSYSRSSQSYTRSYSSRSHSRTRSSSPSSRLSKSTLRSRSRSERSRSSTISRTPLRSLSVEKSQSSTWTRSGGSEYKDDSFENAYSEDFHEMSDLSAAVTQVEPEHKEKVERKSSISGTPLTKPDKTKIEPPRYSRLPEVQTTEASVQTGFDLDDLILKYAWTSPSAHFPSANFPPSHVPSSMTQSADQEMRASAMKQTGSTPCGINSQVLEDLTNYNPAISALNDMIQTQLKLTRNFISMQNSLHESVLHSLEKSYRYTTLEDTKQYIAANRKPRLTFDEALRMVEEEMGHS